MSAEKPKQKFENSENSENRRIGIFEVLKVLGVKLRSEILVLAFAFALIIALVVISSPNLPLSTILVFISLYMVAVGTYLCNKGLETKKQVKKKTNEYIKWRIGFAEAFQNPFVIARERPSLEFVHFDVNVRLKNNSNRSILAKFYLRSPSQAVGFVWDEPIRQRRFGIFLKTVSQSLDIWETQHIDSKQIGEYQFHAIYRPRQAYEDYQHRQGIVLFYSIDAHGEGNPFFQATFKTGVRKIPIPFADTVQYKYGDKASDGKT